MKLDYENTIYIITIIFIFCCSIIIIGVNNPSICEMTGDCMTSLLFWIIFVTPIIVSLILLLILLLFILIKNVKEQKSEVEK